MKKPAAAPLALVGLLGCQPALIDALQTTSHVDGSSEEAAATGDAQPEGAPAAGPLAYYRFDEGSGSTVNDSSGNGYDGQLLDGGWSGAWTAGKFGSAIQFFAPSDGGADEGILVNRFPQAGMYGPDWSVSFWLFIQNSDITDIGTVLSTEVDEMGGWEVNLEPSGPPLGSLQFAFWYGTWYSIASCNCVSFGAWTHIVAVVDGTAETVQLFYDGEVAAPPSPALGPFIAGNPYLYMGRWGGAGRPLVGVLDEVAIFDRTLSTEEIGRLYNGVVPP